jgi:hypothetical protein
MTNQLYSRHPYYHHFMLMIQRCKKYGIECSFKYGLPEFDKWLEVIGSIPEGMEKPTVGRYDHTKGYVFDTENRRWNFRWQEHSENSSECATRVAESGGLNFQTLTSEQQSELSKRAVRLGKTLFQRPGMASENGKIGGRRAVELKSTGMQKTSTCPHCGLVGQTANIKRWHFDNCKAKGLV